MGGDKKIYPISLVVDTLDTRFEGLLDRKVWDKKVWDRNNFLGFFELGS
jgi:hypothetical protein